MDGVAWPVRTERLVLRPATAEDVEAVWAFRRLPEVGRWITSAPTTIDEFRARFDDPQWLADTIIVEQEGQVIGDLMLRVTDAWSQAEITEPATQVHATLGWVIDPAWGGRGLATEAVEALIRICFEDLGLRRVAAECFVANEASWRLMERVGMRREAHSVRDGLHRSGEWMDGFAYALLADEWRP